VENLNVLLKMSEANEKVEEGSILSEVKKQDVARWPLVFGEIR
jgi:hypothetical protein